MSNQTVYEESTRQLPETSAVQGVPAAPPSQPYSAPSPTQIPPMPDATPAPRNQQLSRLLLVAGLLLLVFALIGGGRFGLGGGLIEGTTTTGNQYTAHNLTLQGSAGNVQLLRGDNEQIAVEIIRHGYGWTTSGARRSAEAFEPKISQSGDTLRIEDQTFSGGSIFGRSAYADYRITLPATAGVKVNIGSGNIDGSALQGQLDLNTGSGNISIKGSQIRETALNTGSGNISIAGVSGAVQANTGSGSIEVTEAEQTTLDLHTSSGSITFEGSLNAENDHRAETSSGSITFKLPTDTNVQIDAQTSSGRIDSDWQLQGDDQAQRGQIGTSGSELKLRTSSGNINIERR